MVRILSVASIAAVNAKSTCVGDGVSCTLLFKKVSLPQGHCIGCQGCGDHNHMAAHHPFFLQACAIAEYCHAGSIIPAVLQHALPSPFQVIGTTPVHTFLRTSTKKKTAAASTTIKTWEKN